MQKCFDDWKQVAHFFLTTKETTMHIPIIMLLGCTGFALELGFADGQANPEDKSFFFSGEPQSE